MMLHSRSGFELNRKFQLVLAVLLVGIWLALGVRARMNRPDVQTANGVYVNDCCRDIVINDGRLAYGGTAVPFKLLNMKFGLTGYVDAEFTRTGLKKSSDETAIAFSGEGGSRTISLPVDGREYTFKSVVRNATSR